MCKIRIDKLEPGMRLATPIYGPDGELYLNRGVELKPTYIKYLHKHNYNYIYVLDQRIDDVEVETVISQETRKEALNILRNITRAGDVSELARSLVIQEKKLKNSVEKIINELLKKDRLLVNLADLIHQDQYTLHHSVNVCILALIVGISLGYDHNSLKELGVGAMVHDLGKVCIPPQVLNKPDNLTEEEFKLVKEHPRWGLETLGDNPATSYSNSVKNIVHQHHEKLDGSGYPNRLKKEQIDELSRIVAVTDIFDAVLAHRPYRPPFKPHQAVELLYSLTDKLDTSYINSLLKCVSAYPIGTLVKLSNGWKGIVIKNNVGLTLRPTIRIVEPVEEANRELDLSEELDVTIVDVIGEEPSE